MRACIEPLHQFPVEDQPPAGAAGKRLRPPAGTRRAGTEAGLVAIEELTAAGRRVLMVGDTLHTDILGGAQAGFATALVTGHGSLLGLEVAAAIQGSGIAPDHIVTEI